MNLGVEYKLEYSTVQKSDISELVWKLENQFNDSPESSDMRKCIKCGCVKSESLFVKEQYCNNNYKSTTNVCMDCRDMDNANRYLINKLSEFENEVNVKSVFRNDVIEKQEDGYWDYDKDDYIDVLQTVIITTYNIPPEFVKLKAIMLKIKRKLETLKKQQL